MSRGEGKQYEEPEGEVAVIHLARLEKIFQRNFEKPLDKLKILWYNYYTKEKQNKKKERKRF